MAAMKFASGMCRPKKNATTVNRTALRNTP